MPRPRPPSPRPTANRAEARGPARPGRGAARDPGDRVPVRRGRPDARSDDAATRPFRPGRTAEPLEGDAERPAKPQRERHRGKPKLPAAGPGRPSGRQGRRPPLAGAVLAGADKEGERVAKLMARRGLCSRREAERLIEAGQVLVDGEPVREQGVKAAIDARIEIAELGQGWLAERVTVLMNKPPGIVSTQPEGAQVPAWKLLTRDRLWRAGGEAPAAAVARVLDKPWFMNVCGRLDKDSRGLLVLTQDGVLQKLITGSGKLVKRYRVEVRGDITPDQVQKLNGRMVLDDQPLRPMKVRRIGRGILVFELREGRKHQIRRCCEMVALEVKDLQRTDIGPWCLGLLPEGQWRVLDAGELAEVLGSR